jgi:gliding motility-associated-like protein
MAPNVNCNREVFFTNYSKNATSYRWDFGDTLLKSDTSNSAIGYYKYKKPGTYKVKLIAANNNCADSFENWVIVLDGINFNLPKDAFYCSTKTLTIRPDTFYNNALYLWSNGSTDSTINIKQVGQYWLKLTLGNCNSFDTITISNDSLKVGLESDSLRCFLDSNILLSTLKLIGYTDSTEWYLWPSPHPYQRLDSTSIISQKGKYIVKGFNKNHCPFIDSITIDEWKGQNWMKPINVFTPNGDRTNDVFPELHPDYHYHLQIFDRWGIEIYKAYDQAWDGGQFPDGSYYFFIEMEACGQKEQAHGVLRIIH